MGARDRGGLRGRKFCGDEALGFNRRFDITVQPGAGAYICGEESGMLNRWKGARDSRAGAPLSRAGGDLGQPTTVDNVETLSHVPAMWGAARNGSCDEGVKNAAGRTLFGVSGHVNDPGIFELGSASSCAISSISRPAAYSAGRRSRRSFRAASRCRCCAAIEIDVAMDHESLARGRHADRHRWRRS